MRRTNRENFRAKKEEEMGKKGREREVVVRKRIENGLFLIISTLDTSHFEMSTLNASADENAAKSKKKNRGRRKEEK